MFGLLGFGSIAAWFVLSLWIAWRLAKLVTPIWFKALVVVALTPLLFVAPVGDEIIGKYQFERYCKEAEEVKIYGTILVREPFYTADGKRRRYGGSAPPIDEANRIEAAYQALVRHDSKGPTRVAALIPIDLYETWIVNKGNGEVLAYYRRYATRGGILSRYFETPAIVRAQCFPPSFYAELEQKILPFDLHSKGEK